MEAEQEKYPIKVSNNASRGGLLGFSFIVAFGGLSYIAASPATTSGRIQGSIYIIAAIALGYRAIVTSMIIIDVNEVVTRSFVRTHRYAYATIRSAEVQVGVTGMNSGQREYLMLHLVDGTSVGFREVSAPHRRKQISSEPNQIEFALKKIEQRLQLYGPP